VICDTAGTRYEKGAGLERYDVIATAMIRNDSQWQITKRVFQLDMHGVRRQERGRMSGVCVGQRTLTAVEDSDDCCGHRIAEGFVDERVDAAQDIGTAAGHWVSGSSERLERCVDLQNDQGRSMLAVSLGMRLRTNRFKNFAGSPRSVNSSPLVLHPPRTVCAAKKNKGPDLL
jgi:hypothetical protein